MHKEISRIKSFIPAIRKCDAVYFDSDFVEYAREALYREPVIGYALFQDYEVDTREGAITEEGLYKNIGEDSIYQSLHAITAPQGEMTWLGEFIPEENENFLGYEFDGVEKDWKLEIEELKNAREKKIHARK